MLFREVQQWHHCLGCRDFPMTIPSLASSIASSPATTLAPATPASKALSGPLPSAAPTSKQVGPPPAPSVPSQCLLPRSKCRSRLILSSGRHKKCFEEKRNKRTAGERQIHDAMLAAIFKAVHEDTVPASYVGIYSQARRIEWDAMSPRLLTSGHSQFKSRMT